MSINISVTVYLLKLIFHSNVFVHGILGGHDIRIEDAPYQVNYGDICGGVLLHRQWALTSAHCGTEQHFIRIGSNHRLTGFKVAITSHIPHPNFGKEHMFDFDVQLLKTQRQVHFYKRVSAIKIIEPDEAEEESIDTVVVSGWGYSEEKGEYNEILKQVKLPVISMEICQKVDNLWYNHTLTKRMFCAGELGKDACQGDSGGAAVFKRRVVGISSFGFGCGRNIPGVYINLADNRIRNWIRHYIEV